MPNYPDVPDAVIHRGDAKRWPRERHVTVLDPNTGEAVTVRWFHGREQMWRCRVHGEMPAADCIHAFAAALTLAEHLLGLDRVPDLTPIPERTHP